MVKLLVWDTFKDLLIDKFKRSGICTHANISEPDLDSSALDCSVILIVDNDTTKLATYMVGHIIATLKKTFNVCNMHSIAKKNNVNKLAYFGTTFYPVVTSFLRLESLINLLQ